MENKDSCVIKIGNPALSAINNLQGSETIDIMVDTLNNCENNYFLLSNLQEDFNAETAFAHVSMLREIKSLLLNLKPENQ